MNLFFTRTSIPFSDVTVAGEADGTIRMLHFDTGEGGRRFSMDPAWLRDDRLFAEAIRQIRAYFAGELTRFELPLAPQGTVFQRTVWSAVQCIPFGETRTYGQIATQIGNASAARAVGMANHRNPIPLLIPCHRVIGAGGKLGGYAHGLELKRSLLAQECAAGTQAL